MTDLIERARDVEIKLRNPPPLSHFLTKANQSAEWAAIMRKGADVIADFDRLAVAAGEAIGALEGIMTAMEGLGHGPFDNERAALARFRAMAEGRE